MKDVIPLKNALFSIEASGSEPRCYAWEWKPADNEDEGDEWLTLSTSEEEKYHGHDHPTLVVAKVQPSDQGSYRCVVQNVAGTTRSQPATLTVGMLYLGSYNT